MRLRHMTLAASSISDLASTVVTVIVLLIPSVANALTVEQASESCRQSIGIPFVQACMQGKSGNRDANLAKCRADIFPKMFACVQSALNRANGRANVPLAFHEKGETATVAPGNAPPAGFVAPPRTITDITSVLDNEKPDPATSSKLKADADSEPVKGL